MLREWTPAELQRRDNWDFTEFVQWHRAGVVDECREAFFHEAGREVFSPDPKPFIRKWRKRGCKQPTVQTPWIIGHPLWRVLEMDKPLEVFPFAWGEPVVISLPRFATHEELLATFKVFLAKWRPDPARKGRPDDVAGWFRDLAVYRARMAGLSMAEGVALMGQFLSNAASHPKWRMTQPEWTRGEVRTRQRITELVARCEGDYWNGDR